MERGNIRLSSNGKRIEVEVLKSETFPLLGSRHNGDRSASLRFAPVVPIYEQSSRQGCEEKTKRRNWNVTASNKGTLYTFNVSDFCKLHQEYLDHGKEHGGIIVVLTPML